MILRLTCLNMCTVLRPRVQPVHLIQGQGEEVQAALCVRSPLQEGREIQRQGQVQPGRSAGQWGLGAAEQDGKREPTWKLRADGSGWFGCDSQWTEPSLHGGYARGGNNSDCKLHFRLYFFSLLSFSFSLLVSFSVILGMVLFLCLFHLQEKALHDDMKGLFPQSDQL